MSINYKDMSREELLTPEFYAKGDRDWIRGQLILLNLEHKEIVCAEYREIFLRQGRKEANTYLSEYVGREGSGDNVKASMFASGVIPDGLQARIERLKKHNGRKKIDLGD